jgi:hypothetical protein
MDGHYIDLDRDEGDGDLTLTLSLLLRPVTIRGGARSFPLLVLRTGTEVFVNELGDGLAELAISHPDPRRRRLEAQRIYRVLAERTRWQLRWTADDTPEIIGIRPARPRDTRPPTRGLARQAR